MTVYTVIPSGDRDPESPVTPELIDGLYFNPTAITEGSPGAPSIANAALAGLPWGGDDMKDAISGNYIEFSDAWGVGVIGSTMVKIAEVKATRSGTYNFRLSVIGNSGGGYNGNLQVYINGSPAGTLRVSVIRLTVNEDIAVVAGDLIQLYGKMQNAASTPDGDWKWGMMSNNPIAHLSNSYLLRDI